MKVIDLDTWPRRAQYEFFKSMDYPHINVCFPFDITLLRQFCKSHKLSLTHSILYLTARTANDIREFRLRIRDDQVVEHDTVHPSYTVLRADETFSFCSVEYSPQPQILFERATTQQDLVIEEMVLEDEPGRDDYLFISVTPWISFTSATHPINMSPVDSVPRLCWGKFFTDGMGKIQLPYSIQVHHALADGVHMGKFAQLFQALADKPAETFVGFST